MLRTWPIAVGTCALLLVACTAQVGEQVDGGEPATEAVAESAGPASTSEVVATAGTSGARGGGDDEGAIGCGPTSSDRRPFLFLTNRRSQGPYEIWAAQADGSDQRPLVALADLHIAWFDVDEVGHRVVVAGSAPGWKANPLAPANVVNGPQQVIATVDLDQPGETARVLVDVREGDRDGFDRIWHPTFSPDGSRVVFAAGAPGEQMNLWIVDVESGERTRLVDEPQRNHNDPSWSPAGSVLFARSDELGDPNPFNLAAFDIWTIDADEPLVDPSSPPDSYLRITDEDGLAATTAATDLDPGPKGDTDPSMSPGCRRVVNLRWESQSPLLIGRWSTVAHNVLVGSPAATAEVGYVSDVDHGHTTTVAHWESATSLLVERTQWDLDSAFPAASGAGIWRLGADDPAVQELLVENSPTNHNTLPVSVSAALVGE